MGNRLAVEELLDRAKRRLGITKDADLARKLEVARATLAGWKARGVIPGSALRRLESFGAVIADGDLDQIIRDVESVLSRLRAIQLESLNV